MAQDKGSITLKLTAEQQEQVRQATGKLGDTLGNEHHGVGGADRAE